MTNNPKYRRPLNSDQVETLELLYKFRFGSVDLLREYFNKSSRGLIFNRLKVLEDQGLITKRFDSSYRLQGKPAAYYLLPAGARILQASRAGEDTINIKSIYKESTKSEGFIAHSLDIFTAYNRFKASYGEKLDFFTKPDLAGYEHFPNPLPDAFLSHEADDTTKHFFLEILDDRQPFFTHIRRIQQYIDHKESGEWAMTELAFPVILFVCESASTEKRMQKQLTKSLKNRWVDDLTFATTTKELLKTLSNNDDVWRILGDEDNRRSLGSIS